MKHTFAGFLLLAIIYIDSSQTAFIHDVITVQGMLTNLPCNITPPSSDDQVNLVLWYKDGFGKPLFGFDLRQFNAGNRHNLQLNSSPSINSLPVSRAQFNAESTPTAVLSLFGVRESDTGIYQCRVDFKKSPTRYWKVNLTVIVPPTEAKIFTQSGIEIERGILPSLDENASIVLTCDIIGGWPSSRVTWWKNGVLIDDSFEEKSIGISRNSLTITNLYRDDQQSEFLCLGSNNNETQPLSKSVVLSLKLPPLTVTIEPTTWKDSFVSGKRYNITCTAIGAFPYSDIYWSINGSVLSNFTLHEKKKNMSISILSYQPKPIHHGGKMTCTAKNPVINSVKEIASTRNITIFYAPRVTIKLGPSLKENDVREGDDVYFECEVDANPKASKVSWAKNGTPLKQDARKGIILNNLSLVLQHVSKTEEGAYTCIAANEIGIGSSEEILLNIKYAPECSKQKKQIPPIGYSKKEEVKVLCQVESNPPPTLFLWKYNSTTELLDIPASNILVDGSISVASIKPRNQRFGSLLCWAENEIGLQKNPCVYYLMPADKPDPVSNCLVSNRTVSSLMVECDPGFDGGLQQSFFVVVTSMNDSAILDKKLENKHYPHFLIKNMLPGSRLKLKIFAANSKGRSISTDIYGETMKQAQRHTLHNLRTDWGNGQDTMISPFTNFLFASLIVLLILCGAGLSFTYCARRQIKHSERGRQVLGKHYSSEATGRNLLRTETCNEGPNIHIVSSCVVNENSSEVKLCNCQNNIIFEEDICADCKLLNDEMVKKKSCHDASVPHTPIIATTKDDLLNKLLDPNQLNEFGTKLTRF